MASNQPLQDELGRMLQEQAGGNQLQRDLQKLMGLQGVPLLGQKKSTRRWRCPNCKNTVGAFLVQLPEGLQMECPEGQVFTMLPGEVAPVCLCVQCDVRVRRKLVPAMEEIDEDDTVIKSGLRVVPPSDEGEEQS